MKYQVNDRVEGVSGNGPTGRFGTITKIRRDGYKVEWDPTPETENFKGSTSSVVQGQGLRKVGCPVCGDRTGVRCCEFGRDR